MPAVLGGWWFKEGERELGWRPEPPCGADPGTGGVARADPIWW